MPLKDSLKKNLDMNELVEEEISDEDERPLNKLMRQASKDKNKNI